MQSGRIYAGRYSSRFTSNGGGWYERSCAYKRIIPSSDLSAQGLFYVSRSGISDNNDRFFFIVFRAGTSNLAYAGWRRINGVTRWCLTMRDGAGYVNVYSSARPVPSRWYMVQLHWIDDSTTGLGELWANVVRVCIARGRNTAAYGNANAVRFGLPELYSCRRTTIYYDNCRITTPT